MKLWKKRLAAIGLAGAMCLGLGYYDGSHGGIIKAYAEGIGDWIQTVNGVSADASGNVNVTTVNGHTVAADVPSGAKFTDTVYDASELQSQADDNTTNIAAIEARLSGLTATAEHVESGYTFVGSGGTIATGSLNSGGTEYEMIEVAHAEGRQSISFSAIVGDLYTVVYVSWGQQASSILSGGQLIGSIKRCTYSGSPYTDIVRLKATDTTVVVNTPASGYQGFNRAIAFHEVAE